MPKRTKVIREQKLAKFIYVVVEELGFFCKGKTEPIESVVKQLVELYESNSKLLADKLTLLQDDCKVSTFFLFNRDNQKLWLFTKYDIFAFKNT